MATTTLVLGGTGKTGRRVAERLWEQGMAVRIGSRSGVPPFDWDAPSTWPAAVKGARAVYLSYYPDLATQGAAEAIESFTELAVKSGVLRLVLFSSRGGPEAERCERIVRSASLEWTIVRASEPFVDAEDIADVVVAALTGRGHAGQTYEVTGSGLWAPSVWQAG
jgi:uncharacterized protein YbjT (DUF2867 family)